MFSKIPFLISLTAKKFVLKTTFENVFKKQDFNFIGNHRNAIATADALKTLEIIKGFVIMNAWELFQCEIFFEGSNMKDFTIDNKIFVMCSEPSPDLTAEMIEQAIDEIKTEAELASLFAVVENKSWWIEDEQYDFVEGTDEYKQARARTQLWFSLADKLRDRIFSILQKEGGEIPDTGQIAVLEPFMKRNGYMHRNGWWIPIT